MFKYRVVLRGHVLRRDGAALLVLKNLLKRKGCQAFITNSSNHLKTVKVWKPHVVLENVARKAKYGFKLSNKSKFILLSSEGIKNKIYEDYMEKNHNYLNYFDKICCWGPMSFEILRSILPQKDHKKLFVVGGIRLDLVNFKTHEFKRNEKSIGFVGRFSRLNSPLGPTIKRIRAQRSLDLVINEAKMFYTFINIIEYLIHKTEYTINIRPHPGEDPDGYNDIKKAFGNRIKIDKSLDIADWINKQRCLVTPASTSFAEAFLLKIPIINIDKLAGVQYEKTIISAPRGKSIAVKTGEQHVYEVSKQPESLDELLYLINKPPSVSINEETENFLKDNFNWGHGSALLKMANIISNEAKKNKDVSRIHLPKIIIDIYCWIRFLVERKRNPAIVNYSYNSFYHKKPDHLNDITRQILDQ